VEAAVREVHEETGVLLTAASLRPLGRYRAPAANEDGHTVVADVFTTVWTGGTPHSGRRDRREPVGAVGNTGGHPGGPCAPAGPADVPGVPGYRGGASRRAVSAHQAVVHRIPRIPILRSARNSTPSFDGGADINQS
jgi:ADP-ribose pyrophosphatase YjhB (NUDIX family)